MQTYNPTFPLTPWPAATYVSRSAQCPNLFSILWPTMTLQDRSMDWNFDMLQLTSIPSPSLSFWMIHTQNFTEHDMSNIQQILHMLKNQSKPSEKCESESKAVKKSRPGRKSHSYSRLSFFSPQSLEKGGDFAKWDFLPGQSGKQGLAKKSHSYSRLSFSMCRAWSKSETFSPGQSSKEDLAKKISPFTPGFSFLFTEPGARVRLFTRSKRQTRPGEESHSYSSLQRKKRKPLTAPNLDEGTVHFCAGVHSLDPSAN